MLYHQEMFVLKLILNNKLVVVFSFIGPSVSICEHEHAGCAWDGHHLFLLRNHQKVIAHMMVHVATSIWSAGISCFTYVRETCACVFATSVHAYVDIETRVR